MIPRYAWSLNGKQKQSWDINYSVFPKRSVGVYCVVTLIVTRRDQVQFIKISGRCCFPTKANKISSMNNTTYSLGFTINLSDYLGYQIKVYIIIQDVIVLFTHLVLLFA